MILAKPKSVLFFFLGNITFPEILSFGTVMKLKKSVGGVHIFGNYVLFPVEKDLLKEDF
jgi:hypothetical protein